MSMSRDQWLEQVYEPYWESQNEVAQVPQTPQAPSGNGNVLKVPQSSVETKLNPHTRAGELAAQKAAQGKTFKESTVIKPYGTRPRGPDPYSLAGQMQKDNAAREQSLRDKMLERLYQSSFPGEDSLAGQLLKDRAHEYEYAMGLYGSGSAWAEAMREQYDAAQSEVDRARGEYQGAIAGKNASRAAGVQDYYDGRLTELGTALNMAERELSEAQRAWENAQNYADYEAWQRQLAEDQTQIENAWAQGISSEEWYQRQMQAAADATAAREAREADLKNLEMQAAYGTGVWEGGIYMGEDEELAAEYQRRIETLQGRVDKAVQREQEAQAAAAAAGRTRYADLDRERASGIGSSEKQGTESFASKVARGQAQYQKEVLPADREAERRIQTAQTAVTPNMDTPAAGLAVAALIYQEDRSPWRPAEKWTKQEEENFYYLLADRGIEAAEEYAYGLNDRYAQEAKYEQIKAAEEWSGKNALTGAVATALQVGGFFISGVDAVDKLLEYSARGTITTRPYATITELNAAMNTGVSAALNNWSGTTKILGEERGAGDLYQIAMSVAQSYAAIAVGGAKGSTLVYFADGLSTGIDKALKSGASPESAIVYGLTSATIAAAAEKYSIDSLIAADPGKVLMSIVRQAGIEPTEEAVTYVLDTVAEEIILGDKSGYDAAVRAYIAEGMSRREAERQAFIDWGNELAWTMISSGISGAASAGGYMVPGIIKDMNSPADTATAEAGTSAVETLTNAGGMNLGAKPGDMDSEVLADVEAALSTGRISNSVAKAIGDSEVMSQAFEQITGKKLEGTSHEKQVFIQREARRFAAEQDAQTGTALSVTQSVPVPPEGEPSPITEQAEPITEGQKENAPVEGAEIKGETSYINKKLRESIPQMADMQAVAQTWTKDVRQVSGGNIAAKARELFDKIKGTVSRPGLGEVIINDRSAKDDLSHGVGTAKAAVIPAIPEVIRKGKEIDFQRNWKGRNYDGYIFAAPIELDGEPVYMAAVVKRTSKNKLYLHEVVDSNGNVIKINDGEKANQTSIMSPVDDAGASSPSNAPLGSEIKEGVPSENIVAQKRAESKKGTVNLESGEERISAPAATNPKAETTAQAVRKARREEREKAKVKLDKKQEQLDKARTQAKEEKEKRRQLEKEMSAAVKDAVRTERLREEERDWRRASLKKIRKTVERLNRALEEDSGKRHIPDALKEDVATLLASIDTRTARAGKDQREEFANRMRTLALTISRQQKLKEELGEGSGYLDIPEAAASALADIARNVENLVAPEKMFAEYGDEDYTWTLREMSTADLDMLEETLTSISHAVTDANELMGADGSVKEVGDEIVRYMAGRAEMTNPGSEAGKKLRNALEWDMMTPVTFFRKLGNGGNRMFKELRQGWAAFAERAEKIVQDSAEMWTAKEAKAANRELIKVELPWRILDEAPEGETETLRSGEKDIVQLTHAQAMSLYGLYRRPQGRSHILGAGIRVTDIPAAGTRKAIRQSRNYLITEMDLAEIFSQLTEREKQIAEAMSHYMSKTGGDWGNAVTMKRWGIRGFKEDTYWPIRTDSRNRDTKQPEDMRNASLFRLLNMGFTKPLIPDAHNAVDIENAFDVFADHMTDMAKYSTLALPLLDMMKILNYSSVSASEGKKYTTESVQKSLDKVYGPAARRYLIQLISDINGNKEGGRSNLSLGKLVSNYKAAAVGMNLRVIMLQPTSYVRASAVLSPAAMLHTQSWKKNWEEAVKYSGTAKWKNLGYRDSDINANIRELIKHDESLMDKGRELGMKLAERADKFTWGKLWAASKKEAELRAKKAGKKLSEEKLIEETKEIFDEVIYRTQVMDSTLTRSAVMRDTGVHTRLLTSFMAEPTISYNLLLDEFDKVEVAARDKGWMKAVKDNKAGIGKAFGVYASTALAGAMVASIVDGLRDDDDYESFIKKWTRAFWGEKFFDGNFYGDLDVARKLPLLKNVMSVFDGYEGSSIEVAAISKLYKAWKVLQETVNGEEGEASYYGRMTDWGKIETGLAALSTVTGLPVSGMTRDVIALWNSTFGAWFDRKVKTYDAGTAKNIEYAFKDGSITEETARELLISEGVEEDQDRAYWTVEAWKSDAGDYSRYDRLRQAMRSGDEAEFAAAMEELESHGMYHHEVISKGVVEEIGRLYQGEPEKGIEPSIDRERAIELLVSYGEKREEEAELIADKWTSFLEEGIYYSGIKEAFVQDSITADKAMAMRMKYGHMSKEDARAEVLEWQCYKDTGIEREDLEAAYTAGELSREELIDIYIRYEIYSEEKAASYADKARFVGRDYYPGISYQATDAYWEYVPDMDRETYYQAWKATKDMSGDDLNGDGVNDAYTRIDKQLRYIDGLNLTAMQKDALARALGLSDKNIKARAPWNK